ncbi:MAG: GTP 3',8-cyclase MoaA [Candidatus Bathyarchaeia archaeon]
MSLAEGTVASLTDSHARTGHKLRISVTDRCNFRCQFCMPKTPVWLPRSDILSYEEIYRVAVLFARLGINKIRISGGEPLMRRDIERLVALLSKIPGINSLSMTTNGFALAQKAAVLKEAGLTGLTVSLHSLKPERFSQITGGGPLDSVLAGIREAKANGIKPLKINAVIIRGCNEDEIIDLASLAFIEDVTVRFIEYMPFDGQQMWGMEKVVSGKEIVSRLRDHYELEMERRESGSTAQIYRFADGKGKIGIITSVTEPFCSDCDRIRLSADGKIVPCLFDKTGFDLRPLLRGVASDKELEDFIISAVRQKAPGVETLLKKYERLEHVRPMHTIGG